ncbi:src kinase-associated phosphoprotein 2 isoform X2 [Scomber japonicus]|uniref:src kinase-associated phosphoprotein 2 isoform X2 n=1 Tax=Scomber japonicus TaxID=13676 RepID=UPI0023062745|nr:src kinase-associated phosphoprotein 2 isoform X2 [Scomber japonicus]
MRDVPEELSLLISDLETFLCDGLKGENLSKRAKERREAIIKRIKEVKSSYPHDFKDKSGDDSDDEDEFDSNNEGGSLQSERTDKDEEASEGAQQSPPVAAQDLTSVFKAGYLEKRRKDHSFFGTEWQKRWCALSHHIFYYYGSEKDKQQKGEFSVAGYNVKMNNTLRKDSKKDCCFEISAPDKRVYQFCASSQKEADEWVKEIDFVLRDMSGCIPEEEDEDQEMYDDVGPMAGVDANEPEPIDEDIYEELPEDDLPTPAMPTPVIPTPVKPTLAKPTPAKPPPKMEPSSKPGPTATVDKSTDYQNFYQGLWDCSGDHHDELSFKRGDAIYILSKEYQNFGWWIGEKDGNIGIVPKEYLMELYAI